MAIRTGLTAEITIVVTVDDTAIAAGSGDVPVLATPRLLALAEAATVAAVRDHLDPGTTTLGTRVSLRHRAPSPVGSRVAVTAELTEIGGRRLLFAVEAGDGERPLGGGTVERVVVDREAFLRQVQEAGGA